MRQGTGIALGVANEYVSGSTVAWAAAPTGGSLEVNGMQTARFLVPALWLAVVLLSCSKEEGGGEAPARVSAVGSQREGDRATKADAGSATPGAVAGGENVAEHTRPAGEPLRDGCYGSVDLVTLTGRDPLPCGPDGNNPPYAVQILPEGDAQPAAVKVSRLPGARSGDGEDAELWSVLVDQESLQVTDMEATERDEAGRMVSRFAASRGPDGSQGYVEYFEPGGSLAASLSISREGDDRDLVRFSKRLTARAKVLYSLRLARAEDGSTVEDAQFDTTGYSGSSRRTFDPSGAAVANIKNGACSPLLLEARETTQRMVLGLYAQVARGNPLPAALPSFPAAVSCCAAHGGPDVDKDGLCDAFGDEDVPAGFKRLGLRGSGPSLLFYTFDVSAEGRHRVRARADRDCDGRAEFVVERSFLIGGKGMPDDDSVELRISQSALDCGKQEVLALQPTVFIVNCSSPPPPTAALHVDGRLRQEGATGRVSLLPGPHLVEMIGPDYYAGTVIDAGGSATTIDLIPGCELPAAEGRCPMPSALLARLGHTASPEGITAFAPGALPQPPPARPAGVPHRKVAEQMEKLPVEPDKLPETPPVRSEVTLFPAGRPTVAGLQLGAPCEVVADSPAARHLGARLQAAWAGEDMDNLTGESDAELGLREGDREAGRSALARDGRYEEIESLIEKGACGRFKGRRLGRSDLEKLQARIAGTPGLSAYLAAKARFLCTSMSLTAAGDFGKLAGVMDAAIAEVSLDKERFMELDIDAGADRLVHAEVTARAICCLAADRTLGQGGE